MFQHVQTKPRCAQQTMVISTTAVGPTRIVIQVLSRKTW
jgi:hypothetical protein